MSNQSNALNFNTEYMSDLQLKNAAKLILKAYDLGITLDNATYIGYNTTYGNTYLWSEWVNYSIFISDFDSTIKALYSCHYDGEETIRNCSNDEEIMNKWSERLQRKSEKKENN